MNAPPKYLVISGKVTDKQKGYPFEDDTAARQFCHDWGGYLYENIKGNYLKIK